MKAYFKNKISHKYLNLEKKLPLEKFIPSAFLIFLLCIFILSIISYSNIEKYREDIAWITYTNEVDKILDNIYINAITFTLINTGYTVSGDVDYLVKYDSLINVSKEDINELKNFKYNNPDYQAFVDSLDLLLTINTQVNDLNYSTRLPVQEKITRKVAANLKGIKDVIKQIKTITAQLISQRKISAEKSNSDIQLFIIITGLFSFIVIGLSLLISERLIKNKSKAEDLLMKSYEKLEDRVEERTVELKESNEKLSEEINVRKKTEETLRESEKRFRMMADSAPVFIWISGTDKLFTYLNKAWLEFTGKRLEQELGFGWTEGIHKDDLQRFIVIYNDAFDKKKNFEMEYRLKNSAGEFQWVLNNGIPRFEGEQFAGFIGNCIDINERKKNERFLKIQYEVSNTLAESESVEEASKNLIKNICTGIEWNFGILRLADENNKFINPSAFCSDNESEIDEYINVINELDESENGMGFQNIIIKERRSRWTSDINSDKDFEKKNVALKMGWNSGLGIPVSKGKDVIAIIECFNKKNLEENQEIIDVLESASRQYGNFIERIKAEKNLRVSNLKLEDKVKERTGELSSALSKLLTEISEKEEIQNKIKLFDHAIRSIKDSVFITDLDTNTLFVNQAFENTYGYNEEELLGKEIPVLNKNQIPNTLRDDIINKTLNFGWRGELMTSRKDGTSFFTNLSTSSIKNEEGISEAMVGICRDVSDLKKSEEITRKRNSLLNVLNGVIRYTNRTFEFKKAILYAIDKVCEYTHWEVGHCYLKRKDELISSNVWNSNLNDHYIPFKEYSSKIVFKGGEGYPGKSLLEGKASWMSIKDLTNFKLFRREEISNKVGIKTGIWVPIFQNKEVIGVLEFFKKEEESIDHEIVDCIMNIGLELGSLCGKLDIIEKIRENEKTLNDAQKIAKLGSWDWDVEKNIVTWSNEMYEVYELDKDKFIPTYEGFLERVHPSDLEFVKSEINRSFDEKSSFNFYHRLITSSGKIKTVKAQGKIYIDENSKVIRMFGTGHDVTEIRQAEEDLKKANIKLIETQKELIYNEKLAALGRFSSGIAHEIRNPLANINSLAQLVSKADIDEKNKKRLNYIVANVEIANKIIKNLLSYASPEDLDHSYININDILNSILESIEARCKSSGIEIIKVFPAVIPDLYMDKLKIENALMNFISNSIEAMNSGGILSVKVVEDKTNEQINIQIKDTGTGIPQENLDKILEPFFTTKDEGVGLGMGLAHQTIILHHGKFKINSTYGIGTEIEIKLPINNLNQN